MNVKNRISSLTLTEITEPGEKTVNRKMNSNIVNPTKDWNLRLGLISSPYILRDFKFNKIYPVF
jgi:hypothetical protein